MPREPSIIGEMLEDLERAGYDSKSARRAALREYSKTRTPLVSASPDGIQAVIAAAARKRRQVIIRYKHKNDGDVVDNRVEPYSYRYKPAKGMRGLFKWLYAYHRAHRTIEMYLVRNIQSATATEQPFAPRWPVEIE